MESTKKSRKKTKPAKTHSVYVVELDKEVLKSPKFVKETLTTTLTRPASTSG